MKKIRLPPIQGQCIAEFLGTTLLIFFGTGCVAAMKLTNSIFSQWEISVIWGMAVALSVYLTNNTSGAHLNPAVTIAFWLFSNFERRKVFPYILAQTLGAFFAAALVYILYYNLFFDYEQAHDMVRGSIKSLDLASIFSPYPNPHISVTRAFFIEAIITAVLLCLILVLTDNGTGNRKGETTPPPFAPLLIGVVIAVIGSSMGPLTGFALNPARDFGPKTFAFFAGWGSIAYTGGREIPYFLVPLTAPVIGACLGAFGYKVLTRSHSSRQLIGKKTKEESDN